MCNSKKLSQRRLTFDELTELISRQSREDKIFIVYVPPQGVEIVIDWTIYQTYLPILRCWLAGDFDHLPFDEVDRDVQDSDRPTSLLAKYRRALKLREVSDMPEDTLWLNKTTKGDGAVMNVDGEVYYVTTEKIQQWLDGQFDHGLPLDMISDEDE